MSIEEIKLMAAYMTIHSEDEDECMCIGSSLMNKAVATMDSGGIAQNTPALEGEDQKKFFDLMQGVGKKEDLDMYKKNLIVAGAIMLGNIKDSTNGATEFTKDKVKGSMKTKNYNFYTPQTAEVIAEPKSSKGRKTKRI